MKTKTCLTTNEFILGLLNGLASELGTDSDSNMEAILKCKIELVVKQAVRFWTEIKPQTFRALHAGQLWCGFQVEKIQDLKGRVVQNLDGLIQIVKFSIFLLQVTNVFLLSYKSMQTYHHFRLLGCL
jgi:hypothetical protein